MPPAGLPPRGLAPDEPEAPPYPGAEALRASDSDRDEMVHTLREEFASGRLSHDTFVYRMNAAMEARFIGDLPPLLDGLPPAPPPRPGLLGRLRGGLRRVARRPAVAAGSPRDGRSGRSGRSARSAPAERAARLTSALGLSGPALPAPGEARPPLSFPRTDEGFFTIGRDARCDLAIDDMTVSRIHARLERTPDGWLLKDLSSTNGTRLNGWRVRGQVRVRPGDIVRFGDMEYTLTEDESGSYRQ